MKNLEFFKPFKKNKTPMTIKKVAQKQENVLSFLLDYYASKGEGFTVEQFADELLINNDLPFLSLLPHSRQ